MRRLLSEYFPHCFGKFAENAACNYLKKHGLKLIMRNYSCRYGEIDIIMWDKEILVFVEVRARTNQNFLASLESINCAKQNKIIKTAIFYLQQKRQLNKIFYRFDVVAVKQIEGKLKFHWIQNAFV